MTETIDESGHSGKVEKEPVTTNWVVIIGAPSSGKTTTYERLARLLEHQGYEPVEEVERGIINEDRKKGIERKNTPEYAMELEHRFLAAREELERSLNPSSYVIMDRGLPDIIAYVRYYDADETFATTPAKRVKYRKVFYLEPLGKYEQDETRVEDVKFAQWMHKNLPKVYEELGYEVIRVPVFSEDQNESIRLRSEFIMGKLKKIGQENNS